MIVTLPTRNCGTGWRRQRGHPMLIDGYRSIRCAHGCLPIFRKCYGPTSSTRHQRTRAGRVDLNKRARRSANDFDMAARGMGTWHTRYRRTSRILERGARLQAVSAVKAAPWNRPPN